MKEGGILVVTLAMGIIIANILLRNELEDLWRKAVYESPVVSKTELPYPHVKIYPLALNGSPIGKTLSRMMLGSADQSYHLGSLPIGSIPPERH